MAVVLSCSKQRIEKEKKHRDGDDHHDDLLTPTTMAGNVPFGSYATVQEVGKDTTLPNLLYIFQMMT